MSEDGDWAWDASLYAGSARFYRTGRLPYAQGLAEAVRSSLGLDGAGRLLDVGTGPGIVALELAHLFNEVVGVDADADMIAEAAREAERRRVSNVRWEAMRAESLPGDLGTFRVITFAQSFHWMQRDAVARTVHRMLERGRGRLVLIGAYTRSGIDAGRELEHPSVPRAAISTLVERYVGTVRRAGAGSLPHGTPSGEEEVLDRNGFTGPSVVTIPDDRVFTRTVDDVVASVYTVSGSAPHLFGDRLAGFEADLRTLLLDASPSGLFSEQAGDNGLRIFTPR